MHSRIRIRITAGLLALATCPGLAFAQVDLSVLDKNMAGPASKVLVLGTVHLRNMDEGFDPRSLQPLLDRLAAFKPDLITIESIPGADCEQMGRYPSRYDSGTMARFCSTPAKAKAATWLDVPAATVEVDELLEHWPDAPTPAQRRHLASRFLAANDGTSALVQWLQLPETERHAGDGLNAGLVSLLDALRTKHDEDYLISAPLAARLGLQRVYQVDNHTGDSVQVRDGELDAFVAAIRSAWASATEGETSVKDREQALSRGDDMLALYRYANRPDVLQVKVDSDFGAAMRETSPGHYARYYVAGWETRNLRMVANIREAFRERPGARVLAVVGSSHKPWFDSLLGLMQGVEVVDVEQILQPEQ